MIKLTNPDVTRGLTKVFANQDTLDKQRIEGFRNAFQLSVDKYLPILWQDLTDLTADLSMGTQPDKKWEVVNQQKSRNYLRRVISASSPELDFDHHIFEVDLVTKVYENGFLNLHFQIDPAEAGGLGNMGLGEEGLEPLMRHVLSAFDATPHGYFGFTIGFLTYSSSYLVKDAKLIMGAHGAEGIHNETYKESLV